MKNEKLAAAWDTLAPDAEADARMRSAVLAYNAKQKENEKRNITANTDVRKRVFAPLAACLTILIALGVLFGTGVFGAKTYTATLETGETLSYKKTEVSSRSLDFGFPYGVTQRDLTTEELTCLSPALTEGFAAFRADTGELVRFEGAVGQTKVILAAQGLPATDTIVDETPSKNVINGVAVNAGYCRANNGGKPVALFCGEFQLGDITVYVERAAPLADAQTACSELTQTILQFIQNGAPDLSAVAP